MIRKLIVAVSFFWAMAASPCLAGEDFSASWIQEAGIFRVYNLQVDSSHYGVDFSVTTGSNGEIYFTLVSVFDPSGTEVSSWDGASIFTPAVNIGGASGYWMKLSIVPELSTSSVAIFQLRDWYLNGRPVFGSFDITNGLNDWKKNLNGLSKFSNVATICSSGATVTEIAAADSKKIDAVVAKGMRPMIVLSSILFYGTFDQNGKLVSISLYSDYQDRLALYAANIHQKDKIWSAYILDEYDICAAQIRMSLSAMIGMVNTAIAGVKAKAIFPDVLTVGVAATTQEQWNAGWVFGYPVLASNAAEYGFPSFDLIGFDLYWTQFSVYEAGSFMNDFFALWDKYMVNLNQFILPGQKILLVPGTYENEGVPIPVDQHLELLEFYREIVSSNPRVGAIITFLWPSSSGVVGLQDLPPEVLTGWKDFGKEIITQ